MDLMFKWKWIRIILVVALVGFVLFRIFVRDPNNGYEISTVQRGEVVEELILTGEIVADEHAQLTFPTSGKISWVQVSEGEHVFSGQALAKLDTITLNSALQRARSDYRATQANVDVVHDDLKGNDEDETFEEKNTRTAAEVANDKAYEAVVIAEKNLRESTLIAPFDGIVTYVANPFPGVNVLATQTQVEIINPETIHFKVFADQTEVADIHQGDEVNITMDANEDEEIKGVVDHISFTVQTGEVGSIYPLRVNFLTSLASGFTYRIGMTGDAHFVLNKKENVLFVPADFVKSDSEGDYLLTEEGKEKVYVELGLEGEERTEVVSGIEEGVSIYD